MAVVFFDGFDYGKPALPKWDALTLTPAFTAGGGRRTGTGALELGSGDSAMKALSGYRTEIVVGVAMKGWDEGAAIQLSEDGSNALTLEFGAAPNHYLRLMYGTTAVYDDALAVSPTANTETGWVFFEVAIGLDNTTGSLTVYKDGTQIIAETGLDTLATSANELTLLPAGSASMWYDDLYVLINTLVPLGSTTRVDTLMPVANQLAQFTPSTGSNFECVDEVPYSAADYVESAVTGATDLYSVDPLPYAPTQVYGVQVNVVAQEDVSGDNEVAPVCRPTSTVYEGTAVALTTSAQLIAKMWTTNPQGGSWTRADIGTTRFGVRLTAT